MIINWEKYLDYDAKILPPGMREIIVVKGTPYKMGKQYGEQAKEMIKRNFCLVAGDALKNYTREKVEKRVEMLSADIAKKAPDIHEWYKGIADGANMSYGDIAMINMQLWLCMPYLMCSSIAATGEATADGKTIAGVNGDVTYNMSGYGVTLVAFPDDGNAFVTLPQLAGQMGSNFAMNEKGLIVTFDGGEAELPEDKVFGFADFISAMVYVVSKCDSAKEAKRLMETLGVAGGWIYLFADAGKDIFIMEHTSARDRLRYPGDNGEKNYIHAANHFIHEEMRQSSIDYEMNKDSYLRYNTERKLLSDNLGNHTLESMMDILGCPDVWDENEWHKNVWGEIECNFTPEMRAPDFRTGTRCFGVSEDHTAYILHGSVDANVSYMPNSAGKYCKIQIMSTPFEVVSKMEEDAVLEAWNAARRLSQSEYKTTEKQLELINKAKSHIWVGKNYLSKAGIYDTCDSEEARKQYGYAASEFGYAYIMAQLV